ncbi:hypothetical protein MARGE09_P3937 [Marinagarivorans cellulosilyticus]|uniref:ExoP galactose-binding-like domain-containing protein n=2 Tax=Marinagarivorans cellulosilyticus TaxID=2721545 RepID=A0AAN2BM58_9GAMM|nr:hypothetical protein MARGE09_P3937 [Marinagarivorans cellulosilyticus]
MLPFRRPALFSLCCSVLLLTACTGSDTPRSSSMAASSSSAVVSSISSQQVQSSSAPSAFLNAGADITASNSQLVRLTAQTNEDSEVQWHQVAGPSVSWLQQNGVQAVLITPDITTTETLTLEATVNGLVDTVSISVQPCNANISEDMIFEECTAPGFGAWVSYESGPATGPFFHQDGQGDYHVQWQSVDTGDAEHNQAIEISWNANDPDNTKAVRGWFGLAMPGIAATQGADLTDYANGELTFDMRMVYHEQPSNAAGFIVKMECIHPCSSAEMPIANSASFEWQTHRYPVSQLRATGLDITQVNHAFVIQPDWFNQEQNVTIQIDNIKLSPTVERPPVAEGCIAAGNVSYTLSREANPSADQQEAYNLITAAMDEAVKNYNCYSNLSRHLSVQYNPSVQTADGSTNGNIRFGSRASMHPVTAMHEIAHTFGAGGSNTFRNLVVDGIFQGQNATAKIREITGDNTDVINSDGTHFWPYGLNYISEGGSQQDLINHCLMVEAIYLDLVGQ